MEGLVLPALNRAHKVLGADPQSYGVFVLTDVEHERYKHFASKSPTSIERRDLDNAMFYPQYNTLVVSGQEVQTEQGHLGVIGLNPSIRMKSGRSVDDTIREACDMGGIVVIEHPFHKWGLGKHMLVDNFERYFATDSPHSIDAIEVHNGEASLWMPGFANANRKALLAYNRIPRQRLSKMGAIAVSDGHSIPELGSSYTYLDMPPIDQIQSGTQLTESLREAIKGTSERMSFHAEDSKLGALNHIYHLIKFKLHLEHN